MLAQQSDVLDQTATTERNQNGEQSSVPDVMLRTEHTTGQSGSRDNTIKKHTIGQSVAVVAHMRAHHWVMRSRDGTHDDILHFVLLRYLIKN